MANRPVSFNLHISPLFTSDQRQCMLLGPFGFDLKDYDDVRNRGELIYRRLADKTMPDDDTGPWPDEWIQLFRRWLDEGSAP